MWFNFMMLTSTAELNLNVQSTHARNAQKVTKRRCLCCETWGIGMCVGGNRLWNRRDHDDHGSTSVSVTFIINYYVCVCERKQATPRSSLKFGNAQSLRFTESGDICLAEFTSNPRPS